MPLAEINGVRLNYERNGQGEPVVLVMGTGARGRAWHLYQVPALVSAGFSTFHREITQAEIDLIERGVDLIERGVRIGERFHGAVDTLRLVSPRTFRDEEQTAIWLESLQLARSGDQTAVLPQLRIEIMPNRLAAYRDIAAPCLIIGFEDDIVSPAHLSQEVARSIPGAQYAEVAGCGHLGYLEAPDEVNKHLLTFFQS